MEKMKSWKEENPKTYEKMMFTRKVNTLRRQITLKNHLNEDSTVLEEELRKLLEQ